MKHSLKIAAALIFVFVLSGYRAYTQKTKPDTGKLKADTVKVEADSAEAKLDTVYVGIYITSIHNIDFRNREYSITFWLWLKYKNKKLDFLHTLEIPNAKTENYESKSANYEFVNVDSSKEYNLALVKVQCLMKDAWKINKFPFDKQRLWLTIENSQYDLRYLVFIPEKVECPPEQWDCYIDKRIRYTLRDWTIDSCIVSSDTSAYKTTFGDEPISKQHSDYSALKVVIHISRSAGLLFLKMFLGMYIAFLIAFICFYIRPDNYDSRFQLSVGALFAAIGNKYIVEASLPESTTFTLVDSLHGLTLLFILLTIAATIYSLRLSRLKNESQKMRFDKLAPYLVISLYFIFNIYFILRARSG